MMGRTLAIPIYKALLCFVVCVCVCVTVFITYPISLEVICRRTLYNEGVNYQGIVDVDKESDLFVSLQTQNINSLQLSCSSHVRLELCAVANATVVH